MDTVYIIYSARLDRHYVGMTRNLERRVKQHCAGATRSVPRCDDWSVVWTAQLASRDGARRLEKQIKARGARRFLETA